MYDENLIEIWTKVYHIINSPSKKGFDVSDDESHIVLVTDQTSQFEIIHFNDNGDPSEFLINSNYAGSEYQNLVTISQDNTAAYIIGVNGNNGIL